MNENAYIWVIIGAIVILMAIIGYFAEKTDFGKKELEKQEKNAKQNKNAGPKEVVPMNEDLNVPLEPVTPMNEDLNAPLQPLPMEEDLNVPLEPQVQNEDLNAPLEEVKTMEEDLNVPLGDSQTMSWDEPSSEEIKTENTQDINDINIELPDINSIQNNEVTKDVQEDDDIWKF